MEYKKIGSLNVSKYVYGSWRIEDYPDLDISSFLVELLDLGINTIDTAQVYGSTFHDAEARLSSGLKNVSIREKFNIVTKSGIGCKDDIGFYDSSCVNLIKSAKKSIEVLSCEYIDLFLIHRPDVFSDFKEIKDAFLFLKNNGFVKEFGVSNFNPTEFEMLNNYLNKYDINLVTNQIEYNMLSIEHIINNNIDYLKSNLIVPMIWSPFCGGNIFSHQDVCIDTLTKKYNCDVFDLSLGYIKGSNLNSVIILGSHNIENYKKAVNSDITISKEDMYRILKMKTKREVR